MLFEIARLGARELCMSILFSIIADIFTFHQFFRHMPYCTNMWNSLGIFVHTQLRLISLEHSLFITRRFPVTVSVMILLSN